MWNPLNDIRYGVELERAQMPDNGLNESPGMWNSSMGAISGANNTGVENKRRSVRQADGQQALRDSGYTAQELGLKPGQKVTRGDVTSAVRNHLDDKQTAKDTTAFERSLVPLTKQMEMQNAQFATTLKSQENRYAHEKQENRLDRRHASEMADMSNDLQMQISIMNNDIADKRMAYDRETQRMDRRDKYIATLMSGIGQLGGAFAA